MSICFISSEQAHPPRRCLLLFQLLRVIEVQGGLSHKMVCCFYQKFKSKIAELIFPVKALLQPSKHRDKTVSAKLEERGIRNHCAKISVLEIQLDWGVKLAVI